MTDYQLISGKPKIFTISSNNDLLNEIQEYVENYEYDYIGSASKEDDIFEKVDKLEPHLLFLDCDIENIDLAKLTGDLELFNIPIIIIVGNLFNETVDKLLMSNPYGFLLAPLEENELQRAMAVALRKHEQNIQNVKEAESRIKEKSLLRIYYE